MKLSVGQEPATPPVRSAAVRALYRIRLFASANSAFLVYLPLIILAGWLAFNWYETVRRMMASYLPMPFMDYWRVVLDYPHLKALDLHFLWQQHNAHRIIFPEIIYLLDMLFGHGRMFLPLIVSFLCYFSIWLVIAWALVSDRNVSRFHRALPVLLAGIIIGWKGSASSLAFPFFLQWPLTQLAAILALAFLTLVDRGRTFLGAAIAAAVIATYSSGNGMLIWPVLIATGFLLNLPKRRILALVVSGVLSIGLYFVGYHFSNELNFANFYRHPVYSISFISAYLSMPFGYMKSAGFTVDVGLANISAAICLFIYASRQRLLHTSQAVILFGCYAFALLSAIITAAGRMNVADPTFTAAEANRYVTVPLVNWGILLALCLWLAGRRRWKIISPPVLAVCLAILIAIGCMKLRWWLTMSNQSIAEAQVAMLSIENGLTAPKLIRKIFPDPQLVLSHLPELKKNHLSIYFRGRSKWLGQPAARVGPLAKEFVPGAITKTVPVSSGLEVFGWAGGGSETPRYRWIIFVNESGRITGFGERVPAGTPPDLETPGTPHRLSWVGFVNSNVGGNSFRAYMVHSDRRDLVPLSSPQF